MKVKNPHTGTGQAVAPERYRPMRRAILKVVPRRGEGIIWTELPEKVAPLLPKEQFAEMKTVKWYATVVRLDLEARGLIERVLKTTPIRLRRPAKLDDGSAEA